jgi:hypothetical protein
VKKAAGGNPAACLANACRWNPRLQLPSWRDQATKVVNAEIKHRLLLEQIPLATELLLEPLPALRLGLRQVCILYSNG